MTSRERPPKATSAQILRRRVLHTNVPPARNLLAITRHPLATSASTRRLSRARSDPRHPHPRSPSTYASLHRNGWKNTIVTGLALASTTCLMVHFLLICIMRPIKVVPSLHTLAVCRTVRRYGKVSIKIMSLELRSTLLLLDRILVVMDRFSTSMDVRMARRDGGLPWVLSIITTRLTTL